MASPEIMTEQDQLAGPAADQHSLRQTATLLVSVPSQDRASLHSLLGNLAVAFPDGGLTVATPDGASDSRIEGNIQLEGYTPAAGPGGSWTPTAADFVNDLELLRRFNAPSVLHLGQGAETLAPAALQALAAPVLQGRADLSVARYDLPARTGLVNAALIYPVVRALFAANIRFPLALDYCMSAKACERLAATAQREIAAGQPDSIAWPVVDCLAGGLLVEEAAAGERSVPQPGSMDLNALLARVAGSLFTEVDLRAAVWQRSRVANAARLDTELTPVDRVPEEEIAALQNSFRLAYSNLHEVWSLVLPPQSLLGLKKLSVAPADQFLMPDALWARIVYDFMLAYRLRTLNRGHLLGAMTPLYLAWVAGHLMLTGRGISPAQHIEQVARAFEGDKPYLVSRWRWPDRFNP